MSDLWNGFRDLFVDALDILHDLFAFVGNDPAWGFAIIALTLVVRILMLPLAIKQTRSMRAMQDLQPKVKAIQKKYKADRDLLKKDPEKYKAQRQKQNEEMQALYKDAGVNPAGGCLPLLAQAPIFIALFSVLRAPMEVHPPGTPLGDLLRSDFYFFTPSCPDVIEEGVRCGLSTGANAAGIWGIALIVLMAGSMFFAQRQMLNKTATEGPQAQQQKIMMYVMPLFLAVISFNFPMGVLLYWVTTNVWQVAQQAIVLHEVDVAGPARKGGSEGNGAGSNGKPSSSGPKDGGSAAGKGKGKPASTGKGPAAGGDGKGPAKGKGSAKGGGSAPGKGKTPAKGNAGDGGSGAARTTNNQNGKPKGSRDHIPTRRSRRGRE